MQRSNSAAFLFVPGMTPHYKISGCILWISSPSASIFLKALSVHLFIHIKYSVMAELNTGTDRGHNKGTRSRKLSTRVDMTPMVDLGFLLITFFMLTTALSQPKAMDLKMPADDKTNPQSLAQSKSLTILLGANNSVRYYEGIGNDPTHPPVVKRSSYANNNGIRDVIIDKRDRVIQQHHEDGLMVLIKADKSANYKNVVDIMDEMLINHVERYAMVDITPEDEAYLK
jgi:biopolymer transport protein ExbD